MFKEGVSSVNASEQSKVKLEVFRCLQDRAVYTFYVRKK